MESETDIHSVLFQTKSEDQKWWKEFVLKVGRRFESFDSFMQSRGYYQEFFTSSYAKMHPELYDLATSDVVDERRRDGKRTAKNNPDMKKSRKEANDHYKNALKKLMTRLERRMQKYYGEPHISLSLPYFVILSFPRSRSLLRADVFH